MSNISNGSDFRDALGWFRPVNKERPQVYYHELGAEIGTNEALILAQIIFLVNATQKAHDEGRDTPAYRDGYAWTFHSAEQFEREYFQSISFRTIQNILKKFEESGLLIVASKNYNKRAGDRTKWYRPNQERINQLRWRGGPGIEELSKSVRKTRTEQRQKRQAANVEQLLRTYDQQIAQEPLSAIVDFSFSQNPITQADFSFSQSPITQDKRNQLRKIDVTDYAATASAIPETPSETPSKTPSYNDSSLCSESLLAKARSSDIEKRTSSKDDSLSAQEDYDWSFHFESADSEAFYGEDTATWFVENPNEQQVNLQRDYVAQGWNDHLPKPEISSGFVSYYRPIPNQADGVLIQGDRSLSSERQALNEYVQFHRRVRRDFIPTADECFRFLERRSIQARVGEVESFLAQLQAGSEIHQAIGA